MGKSYINRVINLQPDKVNKATENRKTSIREIISFLFQERKTSQEIDKSYTNGLLQYPQILLNKTELQGLLFLAADKQYFLNQFAPKANTNRDFFVPIELWSGLKALANTLTHG